MYECVSMCYFSLHSQERKTEISFDCFTMKSVFIPTLHFLNSTLPFLPILPPVLMPSPDFL